MVANILLAINYICIKNIEFFIIIRNIKEILLKIKFVFFIIYKMKYVYYKEIKGFKI